MWKIMQNRICWAPADGASGDGGANQNNNQNQNQNNQNNQQQNNQNNNQNNQGNSKDNTGDFDLDASNIWEKPAPQNNNNNNQNNQNNNNGNNNNQQQQPQNPGNGFDTHIAGLDFVGKVPQDALVAFSQGNMQPFMDHMQTALKNVYRQAVTDGTKVAGQVAEQQSNRAFQQSRNYVQDTAQMDRLTSAIPLMSNPNVRPIGEAIFKQFRTKGDDEATAIKKAKGFFAALQSRPATDFGNPAPAGNRMGHGGLGNSDGAGPDGEEINWADFVNGIS